jgi:hypothetical protein
MNRGSTLFAVAILSFCLAASAQAGWGRTLHPVPTAPAVTQSVVVPSTTYYAPATTTYYAPAATTYVAPPTTTYYAPTVTAYSVPATTVVAPSPVVVARPAITTPGYVIPPPRIRLRRAAPSLYVAPSVVVP